MKSTKTRREPIGEDEASSKGPSWFRVTADRFDWLISSTKMKGFKRGQIAYEPRACVDQGLAKGAIELIDKPANARVNKAGQVVFDATD